jgi:hypothetical protein
MRPAFAVGIVDAVAIDDLMVFIFQEQKIVFARRLFLKLLNKSL